MEEDKVRTQFIKSCFETIIMLLRHVPTRGLFFVFAFFKKNKNKASECRGSRAEVQGVNFFVVVAAVIVIFVVAAVIFVSALTSS